MAIGDDWIIDQGVWRGMGGAADIVPSSGPGVPIEASFFGVGAKVEGVSGVSPGYPPGTLAGMCAFLVVETAAQTAPTPSGWAHVDNGAGTPVSPQLAGTAGADNTCGINVFVLRVTVDGGDPVTVPDSGDHNIAYIVVYKDVPASGTFIHVGAGSVQTTEDGSVEWPSVTTTVDKCRIVGFGANGSGNSSSRWNDDITNSALADIVRRAHSGSSVGVAGGGTMIWDGLKASAGVVGVTSSTTIASATQARIVVALLPGLSSDGGGGGGGETPLPGAARTMFGITGKNFATAQIGVTPVPDSETSSTSVSFWCATTTGFIDILRAANACSLMKVTPSNKNLANADGTFSTANWIVEFMAFWDGLATSTVSVTANAARAVGATTVAVSAIPGAIPLNGYVEFGGKKYAKLTAAASSGATSLTVAPLTVAVSSGNVGIYSANRTKVRQAFADRVLRALYALDDFAGEQGDNAFVGGVSYEQLEAIGAAVKNVAPWMPVFLRGAAIACRDKATKNGVVRKYQYCDLAQASYRPSSDRKPSIYSTGDLAAQAVVASNVSAGGACGLGVIGWMNILNWGRGSDDGSSWGCVQGSRPFPACGMSPNEILQAGRALLAAQRNNGSAVHGIVLWAYQVGTSVDSDYFFLSGIQAAFQSLWDNEMSGRVEGPLNIRNDLVAA